MREFSKILFVANGGDNEQPALAQAGLLAEASKAELLTVIDVGGTSGPLGSGPPRAETGTGAASGYAIENSPVLPSDGGTRVEVVARRSIDKVIDAAHSYDLVIKPIGRSGSRRNGRLAREDRLLIRKCTAPVWIERGQRAGRCRRILALVELDVTVGDSTLARSVIEHAAAVAACEGAELHVIDVWEIQRELELRGRMNVARLREEFEAAHRRQLGQLLGDAAQAGAVPHVASGPAASALRDLLKQQAFDLVVVGHAPRAGFARRLLGSPIERLLNRIDCSFLAIGAQAAARKQWAPAPRSVRPFATAGRPVAAG